MESLHTYQRVITAGSLRPEHVPAGASSLTLLMASWLKPDLLLLDEHTAALDPISADKVIQLTQEIVERDKLTTLIVTHSMTQAVNLGDRIWMMHKGRLLHDIAGSERQRITAGDLLERFEEAGRREVDSEVND